MAKPYLVTVGGHACRIFAQEADLLVNDHFLLTATNTRLLLNPSLDELRDVLISIPSGRPVEIGSSLQGKFSLKWVPAILLILGELGCTTRLRIVPVSEEIADFLKLPTIQVEKETSVYEYDVAISYASEDRETAESLATELREHRLRVFYDRFEQERLWGSDLVQHFEEVFADKARFCILLISESYVAEHKRWTRHELAAAQERQLRDLGNYILPVRLDDARVPGLPETIGALDLRTAKVGDVVAALKAKMSL